MIASYELTNLIKISAKSLPVDVSICLGKIKVQVSLTDIKNPLIFTFDDLRSAGPTENRDGWGFNFVKSQNLNVISILEGDKSSWYRSDEMLVTLSELSKWILIDEFPKRISYGTSMGGYAASAFSSLFRIDIALLLSPVSTLSKREAPWEHRYKEGQRNNWNTRFYDGAENQDALYVVVYDPLYKYDRLHAARYEKCGKTLMLPVSGLEHSTAKYLSELGLLKKLFLRVANDENIEKYEFINEAKVKKKLDKYYFNLLNSSRCNSYYKKKIIIGSFIKNVLSSSARPDHAFERVGRVLYSLKEFDLLIELVKFGARSFPDNKFFQARLEEFHTS